ncbi:Nin one binding Zn-ribbon like-domain-containing protein [Lipomyces oligophaga]|uniref:Nin one binding Zn-ribbon like-domain-containing protein n=1 Tax=Lipomyces oligophaga TaxID=45792 RepID=UPI0034CDC070
MSRINTLVLDAGPLINNAYSTLHELAEVFVTTPSVHAEIRDERARANLLLWGDRLTLRQPKPESVRFVNEFARKTGDYSALSTTDLHIIALSYEIECELVGSGEHLRKAPVKIASSPATVVASRQSTRNTAVENVAEQVAGLEVDDGWSTVPRKSKSSKRRPKSAGQHVPAVVKIKESEPLAEQMVPEETSGEIKTISSEDISELEAHSAEDSILPDDSVSISGIAENIHSTDITDDDSADNDDDDGDWITPDNIETHQLLDSGLRDSAGELEGEAVPQIAMASSDFAMQNVALQIGIHVINPGSGRLITRIRSWMLRCHACYFLTPPPTGNKPIHFCPRCGGATLLRCTVTTSASTGQIQIHLKKNFQWSHRGDRYSMTNPQSRKVRKSGTENVQDILLREDQKEYLKAVKNDTWQRRHNEKMLEEWVGSAGVSDSPFASGSYKREAALKTGVKVGRSRYVNERKKK